MNSRAILHSDLNSFYASVEMMLDPRLKGKAVAVCGATEDRHGIVLAKSELAKKAGVKTGMVNWETKQKCKDLILVPPQYDQYLKYSKLTRAIYNRYTDMVEPFGMDECWIDVTQSGVYGSPMEIAEEIRQSVREEIGMTVSVGVSFNKIFAKLGSDMKKPDAITEITQENFREKVWPLHCSEMIYCGQATTRKLENYGYHTIGDVAQADPAFLKRLLGINGVALWQFAAGQDMSRVAHKDYVSPIKSVGHGITCVADLENEEGSFGSCLSWPRTLAIASACMSLPQGECRSTSGPMTYMELSFSASSRYGRSCPRRLQQRASSSFKSDISGTTMSGQSASARSISRRRPCRIS